MVIAAELLMKVRESASHRSLDTQSTYADPDLLSVPQHDWDDIYKRLTYA